MFTERLSHLSWGWGCFAGRGSSGPCTTCRCARSSRCPAGAGKLPPARRSHTRCARPVGGPCPLWLDGQNTHTGQTVKVGVWWMNLIHLLCCDFDSWSFLCCLFERRKCYSAGTTTHNEASRTEMSLITLIDITITSFFDSCILSVKNTLIRELTERWVWSSVICQPMQCTLTLHYTQQF